MCSLYVVDRRVTDQYSTEEWRRRVPTEKSLHLKSSLKYIIESLIENILSKYSITFPVMELR